MTDQKLRDDMMYLRGHLAAIKFPLILNTRESGHSSLAYYDLIDNIAEQYDLILKQLFGKFDDE